MAPVDRAEHRQQRMRGAGVANVQHQPSFSLANLLSRAPKQAKQSSLPPQPSSRRTPVRTTPRGVPGSAQRHRSASVQRSSNKKRSVTPKDNLVTPKGRLGKRKRGSKDAVVEEGDEEDDLSPNRDSQNAVSIEKPRRIAATVSPIREETDDQPDELSFVEEMVGSTRKTTPAQAPDVLGRVASLPATTPMNAPSSGNGTGNIARSNKTPATAVPATPAELPVRRKRPTPGRPPAEPSPEEDVDELTPQSEDVNIIRSHTKSPHPLRRDGGDVDELSPEQTKDIATGPAPQGNRTQEPKSLPRNAVEVQTPIAALPRKRGRPRRVTEDAKDVVQPIPAMRKALNWRGQSSVADAEVPEKAADARKLDEEIPPASVRMKGRRPADKSDLHTRSANSEPQSQRKPQQEEDEEHGEEDNEDSAEDSDVHARQRRIYSPPQKQSRAISATDRPPKKRQKRGPTQAIKVMRLPGFGIGALTVVDTTRTVVEEWTTHRINRMTEKLANIDDPARARKMRQQRNAIILYKEELDDVLLGLQDANDTGIAQNSKLKQLNKENRRLRGDYIQLQRDRDQIALQNDEATEAFLREKREIEAQHELSSSLYDIQAAVEAGRDRARREGREEEGPQIPIKMLLDDVAMGFGKRTGLLARVKDFNGALGRAAAFLEGKKT